MRLNFTANNFVFGRKNRENATRTFFTKRARRKLPKCVWTSQQTASFMDAQTVELRPEPSLQILQAENFGNASELHGKQLRFQTQKSGKCAHNFFHNPRKPKTSKMRLNFTANRLIFGRINREIVPRTFSVKLAGRELPKCVWTSREIPSFLNANILKMRSELFFVKLQGENLQNASGLHSIQLRFCTQKSWKCTQNIFVNFGGGQHKKCIWTSRQTALLWDAKIGKLRPDFLYKLCKQRISKMRLNFLCCDLRTASILKICLVHLWKNIEILYCEIFSSEGNCVQNMQVPIFKSFVGWRPKKVPKVPFFFGLEGTPQSIGVHRKSFSVSLSVILNLCRTKY